MKTAATATVATRRTTDAERHPLDWTGLDVGSPFDHPRSGILYIARHLPQPGRDGLPEAYLTELRELITAAGGRTLGLFSSMRAARQAAAELRDTLGFPLLCQGERLDLVAGGEVRRGRTDLPVRHDLALAGRRRARPVAAAGRDRPDPFRARMTRSRRPGSERWPLAAATGS